MAFHVKSVTQGLISRTFHRPIQVRYAQSKPFIPFLRKSVKPVIYYSLKERLAEKDEKLLDAEKFKKVNIGFSLPKKSSSRDSIEKRNLLQRLKRNSELEKEARRGSLNVDLKAVEKEWNTSERSTHVKAVADSHGIYSHLFGDFAYFYPVVHMDIAYEFNSDTVSPVYFGNLLKPKEATTAPIVEFESDPDQLWTLVLSNPDGNLYDNEAEILHWFVANIPGGKIKEGEEIVDYLRPIPPKGTGFHRFCFVLYKQEKKLDFSDYRKQSPCINLKERTFKTSNFYRQFEDHLTPAGLAWFQADYDSSLTDFFHHTLQMKEPIYEYQFPKQYINPQKFFPHLKPFNRYMDLHRDPKEMQKIMLLKRLKRVHPFEGEPPLFPFPQALPMDYSLPIWMQNELRYERDGQRYYRDMYRGDDRPYIHSGKYTHPPRTDFSKT